MLKFTPTYRVVLGFTDDADFYGIVQAMRTYLTCAPAARRFGHTPRFTSVPDDGYGW